MSNDVQENRIRRMAERRGYYLTKSRRRDERAADYGLYLLTDINTSAAMLGGWTTLDQVKRFLSPDKPDWASYFARKIDPEIANYEFKREPFEDRDVFGSRAKEDAK
jgi:hypothetical protein